MRFNVVARLFNFVISTVLVLSAPATLATGTCDFLNQSAPETGALSSSPDLLVVGKDSRKLVLVKDGTPLKQYHVSLGFSPRGAKRQSGDGKTPEGRYFIEYKKEQSAYHKALRISYPNASDVKRAKELGVSPGGDIMLHGFPNEEDSNILATLLHNTLANWTQGCVAVTNVEIEEIFSAVQEGTPIEICP